MGRQKPLHHRHRRAGAGARQLTLGAFKLTELSTLQASSAEVDGVALGHELARAPGSVGTTRGKHVATD